ncbi:hypothetical protein BH10PLA1_BH10PLA1_20870 [soil metagenome]
MRFAACLAVGIVFFAQIQRAQACLRPEIDERAIQWSTAIVKANLVSTKPVIDEKNADFTVTASVWKITKVYDGTAKADAEITLLTFVPSNVDAAIDPCSILPLPGKSALLLLRPVKDCDFIACKDIPQLTPDAFVMVQRLAEEDATDDAVKDLQQKIAETRKAEAGFNDKDAHFQAETLANAVDDTEADHADSALLEMGPRAVPAMKDVMVKVNAISKSRLKRIIEELSPPPADTGRRAE